MRRTKKPRVNRNRRTKARRSKIAGKRKATPLPAELLAPMTGEVEEQLRQLVQRFGIGKVRDALIPLIAECKFSDWQCVANAVDHIAKRQKPKIRG
jgi:hypothetical protein